MTRNVKRDDRVARLFDHLAENPDGVTKHDIAADQNMSWHDVSRLVQGLRDTLAVGSGIAVVCRPDPADLQGPHLYRLVETYAEIEAPQEHWTGDVLRRIETGLTAPTAVRRNVDGRSRDARRLDYETATLRGAYEAIRAMQDMLSD